MSDGKFTIAIYVDNKFGVLSRITAMFTRRGFNIDSITAGETESPDYERITITMRGDEYTKHQIISQLRKLFNVKKVEIMDHDTSIMRELLLIKVKNSNSEVQSIMAAASVFRAKIVDFNAEALCIEATGESSKIDAFIEALRPYGIIEMCRTGVVALERGAASMLNMIDRVDQ